MTAELIWLIIGLVLIGLEILLPSFILIFFGVGGLLTALCCLLGIFSDSFANQISVFAISSVLLLLLFRKSLINKWIFVNIGEKEKFLDEFSDKEVEVISEIPGGRAQGIVMLKGANWSAISEFKIPRGELARVIKREGLVLVVVPLNEKAGKTQLPT